MVGKLVTQIRVRGRTLRPFRPRPRVDATDPSLKGRERSIVQHRLVAINLPRRPSTRRCPQNRLMIRHWMYRPRIASLVYISTVHAVWKSQLSLFVILRVPCDCPSIPWPIASRESGLGHALIPIFLPDHHCGTSDFVLTFPLKSCAQLHQPVMYTCPTNDSRRPFKVVASTSNEAAYLRVRTAGR